MFSDDEIREIFSRLNRMEMDLVSKDEVIRSQQAQIVALEERMTCTEFSIDLWAHPHGP